MALRKYIKSSAFTKKKYNFKIACLQHPVKRTLHLAKADDEWLKKFYLN